MNKKKNKMLLKMKRKGNKILEDRTSNKKLKVVEE